MVRNLHRDIATATGLDAFEVTCHVFGGVFVQALGAHGAIVFCALAKGDVVLDASRGLRARGCLEADDEVLRAGTAGERRGDRQVQAVEDTLERVAKLVLLCRCKPSVAFAVGAEEAVYAILPDALWWRRKADVGCSCLSGMNEGQ